MVHFKAVQRSLFNPSKRVAAFCTVVLVGLACIMQSAKVTDQSYCSFYHTVCSVGLIYVE